MLSGFFRIAAAALVCAPAATLTILAKPAGAADPAKYKNCMELRSCRATYTKCFNRLEKEVKPANWSAERDKCVVTYKACIDKSFQAGEMLFTRWFVPDEDCAQYK